MTFSGTFLFYTVRYTSDMVKVIGQGHSGSDKTTEDTLHNICWHSDREMVKQEHIDIKGRQKSVNGRALAWDSPLDSCSHSSNGTPITKHTICRCNNRAIFGITNTIHELWKRWISLLWCSQVFWQTLVGRFCTGSSNYVLQGEFMIILVHTNPIKRM